MFYDSRVVPATGCSSNSGLSLFTDDRVAGRGCTCCLQRSPLFVNFRDRRTIVLASFRFSLTCSCSIGVHRNRDLWARSKLQAVPLRTLLALHDGVRQRANILDRNRHMIAVFETEVVFRDNSCTREQKRSVRKVHLFEQPVDEVFQLAVNLIG